MKYYFVVNSLTDVIETYVMRNVTPPSSSVNKFVVATGVQLTFFLRLSARQSFVTLEEVIAY